VTEYRQTEEGNYLIDNDECPLCREPVDMEAHDLVLVENTPPGWLISAFWRVHRACAAASPDMIDCPDCAEGREHDHADA
jgi:hypothetical protein